MLVPGDDWVVADLHSGALLRPTSPAPQASPAADPSAEESTEPFARPLQAVQLTLGAATEPADPARPEAVTLAGRPVLLGTPRKRATRRFLRHLATSEGPLLGTLGPSVSYSDLEGTRPSVVVVAPREAAKFGTGPGGQWCQFLLGDRRHALPSSAVAPSEAARGRRAPLLVIGLGRPRRGQVPKVVLGVLSVAA